MTGSNLKTRIVTITLGVVTLVAMLASAAWGLAAWPSYASVVSNDTGAVLLGVDDATAVSLGPSVDAEDKFAESAESTLGAGSHALLLLTAAKATAPVPAVRKSAPRRSAPRIVRTRGSATSSSGWRSARVSWYGPGFYGNTMAGGGKLTTTSMVVAHRSLPFGTKIMFEYRGRTCVAVVQDRGPYVGGRTFDLGPGTAKSLGFSGVGTVRYRILGR